RFILHWRDTKWKMNDICSLFLQTVVDQYASEDLHLIHLFMDNLYMNFDIALKLKNLGIKFCGTMRENRGKEICKANMKKTVAGDLVVLHNEDSTVEITCPT